MILSSQPRFGLTLVTSHVNNNKEEGGAAMTDFVKFQRHLTRFLHNGECLFLYYYSNNYYKYGSLKGRYNISLRIMTGHEIDQP